MHLISRSDVLLEVALGSGARRALVDDGSRTRETTLVCTGKDLEDDEDKCNNKEIDTSKDKVASVVWRRTGRDDEEDSKEDEESSLSDKGGVEVEPDTKTIGEEDIDNNGIKTKDDEIETQNDGNDISCGGNPENATDECDETSDHVKNADDKVK